MNADRDRLLSLLADRALVGLGAREQIELAELLLQAQAQDGDLELNAFDDAASAIALVGLSGQTEPLPASLAAAIEQTALGFMASNARPAASHQRPVTPQAPPAQPFQQTMQQRTMVVTSNPPPSYSAPGSGSGSMPPSAPISASGVHPGNLVPFRSIAPAAPLAPRRSNVVAIAGWLAAAACLLLAIGAFATRKPAPVAIVVPPPPSAATAPSSTAVTPAPTSVAVTETAADLRQKLLAAAGTARAEWSQTKDPGGKGAQGEVLWNKDLQKGTMTFRGLAKNEPSRLQYQLWIFDKTRDDKYPVDGGVFDVDAETGDVVVAIHAALPVSTPTLFAITVEKPGGVVVSKREHLVLTAKMPG